MKKIKLFLASSISDLRIDRLEVGDFIRQLNEIYFDRGVQFFLCKCEDYDNAIAADGKQSEYDREIRDSELCFFLFFKKVGDYTRHEFEVALDAFKTCKKPKIVTYFKYVETPDEAQGEVKAFMQMLDGEIRHYYNIYQNIDTLKLGVLMQIKLMGLDAGEPKVENGKVTFGGQTVADTAALPVFAGNASLSGLKEKHRSLTEKYYELREELSSDLDDEEAEEEYRKVASERAETEKKLREAEKGVLEAMKSMAEQTAKGELSARQVAAYRAFEQGNYQGALEILDFHEIMADLSHNEQMAEGYKAHIQTNVNELLQRIQVLKADSVDKEVVAEIEKIYEEAVERIEKFNLDKDPLYDYAQFLYRQNNFGKAMGVADRLSYYYADPRMEIPAWKRAGLWNMLGIFYADTSRIAEAEAAYKKAISATELLIKSDPAANEPRLALLFSNLGTLYARDMRRVAEAEEVYKKALAIFQRLAESDSEEYLYRLASTYNNLGNLYRRSSRFGEAGTLLVKALEIHERLAKRKPALYEADLAMSYQNLGVLYFDINSFAEAEEAYGKALSVFRRLAKADPAAHEPDVARCGHSLAELYRKMQRFSEAEALYKEVIALRERLSDRDPALYLSGVTKGYDSLGDPYSHLAGIYMRTNRLGDAKKAYLRAIEIYNERRERAPEEYAFRLAGCYYDLGRIYISGDAGRAEAAFRKAYGFAKSYPQNAVCAQIASVLRSIFEA